MLSLISILHTDLGKFQQDFCLFCCELEWPRLVTVTLCPCLCFVALLCGRVEDCYRDQSMQFLRRVKPTANPLEDQLRSILAVYEDIH